MPQVYSQVITAPEGNGDLVPTLPYVLYESAAPDFEFRSLINPTLNLEPVFESQMRVASFRKSEKVFSGTTTRLGYKDDTEMSISSLLSRWSANRVTEYRYPVDVLNIPHGVFAMIGYLFGFWSGQVKHKCFVPPIAPETPFEQIFVKMENFIGTSPTGLDFKFRSEDGMNIISNEVTQVLEFVVPFLSSVSFLPCLDESTNFRFCRGRMWWLPIIATDTASVNPTIDYVSGGPDFSFYYPLPPPPVDLWPSYAGVPAPVQLHKKSLNFTKMDSLTETSTEEFEKV
jgi:hypothetical protein